jgi:hypothetical protein
MQKIDTREAFLEYYYSSLDYECSPVFMYTSGSALPAGTGNKVFALIEPLRRSDTYIHPDFNDLPDEFFVDALAVSAQTSDIACPITRAALLNTCITRENFWVFREGFRFSDGTYKVPGFIKTMDNLNLLNTKLAFHFPHESTEDPTMLAYTPSHDYGKRDRQVRIKVGKYLAKYYGDTLTQEQIRAFANGAKGFEVKFADDKEGFRRIYANGPSSCMSGSTRSFDLSGDVHPVDVYEGDFRLAYIEAIPGRVSARGFVHEPTKTYVRTYGNEADTLGTALDDLGYTFAESWEGAYLKRVEDNHGRIVLPYLDGDIKTVREVSGGRWLITDSRYDITCDFTNGTPETDEGDYTCDVCGDRHHEDDSHWSEYHERTICGSCIEDYTYAYIGRHHQTYVHNSDVIYNESDGNHYSREHAEEKGLVETDDGWYDLDDCIETIDGEYIHADDALQVGTDSYGNPVYVKDSDLDTSLIIEFDRAQPVAIWHEDYVPEDTREDALLTDDYGTQTGVRFRTVKELLLIHGVETTHTMLHLVKYFISLRTLEWTYTYLIKKAA